MRNYSRPAIFATCLVLALCACTRTPSPAADGATAASAPASSAGAATPGVDACDALRKRVSDCLANVRRGSLQLQFDPATMTDPAQCRQVDETFDSLADLVQCEDAAP